MTAATARPPGSARRVLPAAIAAAAALLFAGPGTAQADDQQVLLDLINQQRAAAKCPAVALDPRLSQAAQLHADDVLQNSSVVNSHIGSDDSTPRSRIAEFGYAPLGDNREIQYWSTGGSPQDALNLWMTSQVHRDIILTCSFTDVGLGEGHGGGRTSYVGDFARH